MLLTISDDGAGMPAGRVAEALVLGIGVRNVNERLKVIYGPEHGLELESRLGEGTAVRIRIPTGEGGRVPVEALG
jgi:sensor histidine kinase YesM